jgi:hypothetical protein
MESPRCSHTGRAAIPATLVANALLRPAVASRKPDVSGSLGILSRHRRAVTGLVTKIGSFAATISGCRPKGLL